ncbi:F-box only protein 30a [Paramisgurnus dabryanus]|uniref:F-box only protein 30a n=1 Tax=Paramisgurnus dabryanus TaxID=90735 RepID=UPI0031F3BAA5
MEELHIHCLKCVNRRCMIRPEASVSCDLMGCPLVCGAIFHSCKLNEHRSLCPYERVPCLNHGFGCPFTIPRIKLAKHLETCPASVVCCTMEWNRWPVSYSDRKSYEHLSKEVCDVDQLDMALALQDQRMLLESLKLATTVTKTLEKQNHENERMNSENALIQTEVEGYRDLVENNTDFAATFDVLNSAKNIDLIVKDLDAEKKVACRGVKNGDGDFRSEEMKESDTDSDSDLGAVGGADCPFPMDPEEEGGDDWLENNEYGESSEEEEEVIAGVELNGLNGFHEEHDDDNQDNLERVSDASRMNGSSSLRQVLPYHSMPIVAQEQVMAQLPLPLPMPLPNLLNNNVLHHLPFRIEDRWLNRKLENLQALRGMNLFTINGRKAMLTKMEDKAVDTSDLEVADDPMGLNGIDLITAALLFCLGDSPGGRSISDSRFVDRYRIDLGTQTFSFPSAILATSTMVGDIASASACDHASPQLSNPSPFHTLRLDLVLECVTRYQTKQRSMFTFVCGQLFRRDEFSSHFKNVHGDIHAGLSGWMEQRCPLAYYGCTYSQRRFCPSVQGSRIIHDRYLGSFGVQPGLVACPDEPFTRSTCHFGLRCDHLSDLPFELLQHIAGFLDGFSLCQLSRVSSTMRNVCASLLQARGMVVLIWGKTKRADGTSSWRVQDKVWRFSTAFDTVNEWKFANISSMADHLKTCKFNTIARREDAVPLPCMSFTRELTKEGRSLRSVLKPVI